MSREAELPDGTVLEFPDGTADEVIDRAVKSHLSESSKIVDLPTVQAEVPNPADDMSFAEQAGARFIGSFKDLYQGTKQAVTEQIAAPANALRSVYDSLGIPGMDAVADPLNKSLANQQAAIDEEARLQAPLKGTAGGITGDITGSLVQLMGPGVLARGTKVQSMLLPRTIKGNAIQGGAFGAMQPTQTGESRATNVGLGFAGGGAGAAVAKGVGGAYRMLAGAVGRPTLRGAEKRAAQTIAAESSGLAGLSIPAPSAVPGVQRTLAEESLDPGIARLERQMRGQTNVFQPIDTANNAARVKALSSFAKDDAAVAKAVEDRALASNPLRREAMKIKGVDTNRLLGQVKRLENAQTGRPAIQKGLQDIRSLLTRDIPEAESKKAALAPLQTFIDSDKSSALNRDAAKAAMTMIRNGEAPSAKFTASQGTKTQASAQAGKDALADARKALNKTTVGHDEVAVLDNVRKTIGDMLSGKYGGDSAQALAGSRELMAVKNQLDRVLSKQAPAFGEYLEAFKAGSKPINRMKTGQNILEAGGAVLDSQTGVQVLTPASFSKKARDLDGVAAAATGFKKARADQILEPQDFAVIRAVQDDLERQSFRATAGSGGNSMTHERMMLQDKLGSRLAGKLPFVGGFVEALDTIGNQRVNERMAYLLANPAEARRVLGVLGKKDRATLNKALFQLSASSGSAAPTLAE